MKTKEKAYHLYHYGDFDFEKYFANHDAMKMFLYLYKVECKKENWEEFHRNNVFEGIEKYEERRKASSE